MREFQDVNKVFCYRKKSKKSKVFNICWFIEYNVGMLRVITRPEFDPTRSKEAKYPTRTRPEI